MSTKQLTVLLIGFLAAAGLLYVFASSSDMPAERSVSSSTISDPGIRATLEGLGGALKQVSLLAPAADLKTAMEAAYGPYVTPELLVQWEANPERALGRTTSSPWPDRVVVASMDVQGAHATADGTVVEVANGSGGAQEVVGTYPVHFELENRGGTWLVSSAQKGAYSEIPARATITGTYACLPHKDTGGPQTMECALGLKEDTTGDYYSIDTNLIESTEWQGLPTGTHIEVSGVLTPIEMLNSMQQYDIAGIISATSIRRID